MYFSLVLTAGEHSPLDLRGLFLFLEEKLIVNVKSVTQIKYGRAESVAVGCSSAFWCFWAATLFESHMHRKTQLYLQCLLLS